MHLRRHKITRLITLLGLLIAALPALMISPQPVSAEQFNTSDGTTYMTSDSAFRVKWDAAADQLKLLYAPSGTAGNSITWGDGLIVDTSGRSLLQLGNDTGSCTTAKIGRLRYDDGTDTWEYCDGASWAAFGSGGGASALNDLSDAITYYTSSSMYLGQGSGTAVSSGTYNVALGVDTLQNCAGCTQNVAVGYNAGFAMTGGDYNILMGYGAGDSITDGDANVIIGDVAGRALQTGNHNTFIGDATGTKATGSDNTIVGFHAGLNYVTGNDNTFLGRDTGATLTDGSSNILIGAAVDVPAATTSNYLSIGNTIYGDLSTDKVGIGTATPAAMLEVAGEIKFSSSGLACGAAQEGAVRYTGGDPPWEYCDGAAWVNFKQPRCQDDDTGECYLQATRSNDDPDFTAANIADGVNILGVTGTMSGGGGCASTSSGCTNPGDVCTDGTVFAGCPPTTYDPIYVTRCDAGQTWDGSSCTGTRSELPWNNGNTTGYTTTGATSFTDGEGNTATIIAIDSDSGAGGTQPHQAAQYCADLDIHGHTDWYLPAATELHVIYQYKSVIGGFYNKKYWSSMETPSGNEYAKNFNFYDPYAGGDADKKEVSNNKNIRCTRRN